MSKTPLNPKHDANGKPARPTPKLEDLPRDVELLTEEDADAVQGGQSSFSDFHVTSSTNKASPGL